MSRAHSRCPGDVVAAIVLAERIPRLCENPAAARRAGLLEEG
jgi:hypothetical protein